MVLLQHKLSVKLSQRQILTPGLAQMVSVLAPNKLELKDMINAEMVENPVLEELEESVPLIDEVGRKDEDRDRLTAKTSTDEAPITAEKKDPFDEIDFGSFFQDYLDPGYRTRGEMEEIERPSFENFLSKPTNLTDHLAWQLGALSLRPEVREAAEQIIGNLNEDGYLIASDEEMLGVAPPAPPEADAATARNIVSEAQALGLGEDESSPEASDDAADDSMSVAPTLNPAVNVPVGAANQGLEGKDLHELIGAAANAPDFSSASIGTASLLEKISSSPTNTPEGFRAPRNGDGAGAAAPAPEVPAATPHPVYRSTSPPPIFRKLSKSCASSIPLA